MSSKGIVGAVTFGVLACLPATGWAWTKTIAGGLNGPSEAATAVAFDPSTQAVVAAGFLVGHDEDFVVAKLDPDDGSVVPAWPQPYGVVIDDAAGFKDEAKAVAVDSEFNVIAAGFITTSVNRDFFVVKLSGVDGSEIWRYTLNGAGDGDDEATAIAIDPTTDDVIAVGFTKSTATAVDLTVVKLTKNGSGGLGQEAWAPHLVNPQGTNDNKALAVALDPSGDIVVGGYVKKTVSKKDFYVTKLAGGSGTELWLSTPPIQGTGGRDDQANAVAIDPVTSAVFAAGELDDNVVGREFAVIKFSSGGVPAWQSRISIGGSADGAPDEAKGIALDGSGNPIAVGYVTDRANKQDAMIVKLFGSDDGAGGVIWPIPIKGIDGKGDFPTEVDVLNAVAFAGSPPGATSIVAVGSISNRAPSRGDGKVFKFDPGDGKEVWNHDVMGTKDTTDELTAVAVDGDVIAVAGFTTNEASERDFTVVKFAGGNGGDYPCGNAVVDPGEDCDDGNLEPCDDDYRCNDHCEYGGVCGDNHKDDCEQCDDGNLVDGDICSSQCRLTECDACDCQATIGSAGRTYVQAALKARQRCRDRITVDGDVETTRPDCEDASKQPKTTDAVQSAADKFLRAVTSRCLATDIPLLTRCPNTNVCSFDQQATLVPVDATVEEYAECLLDTHRDLVTEIIKTQYGD